MSDWHVPPELPDLRRVGVVGLDSETKDDRLRADMGSGWPFGAGHICGLSVAYRADGAVHGLYLPIRHPDTQNFDPAQVYRWVRDHIAAGVPFVTQNGLYDWGWLRKEAGIKMPPGDRLEEIGALATMVDENRFKYSLDALCAWRGLPGKDDTLLRQGIAELGLVENKRKKLVPQTYIWQLPARYVGPYAEADAVNTLRLFEDLNPIVDREGTRAAYRLECDILPMVQEMRLRGIRVDLDAAERARDLVLGKRDAALTELSQELGYAVSTHEIHSPKWLVENFDRQGIKYPRTEKGNPSFTSGKLGWMTGHAHWLPRLIAVTTKYNKAAGDFLQGHILDHAVNGRLHAEINPHRSEDNGTKSFRFSYSDPPLQQMPSRDEELAPLIRGCFLPEEGEVWAKPDASQQEFRLVVHYANRHNLHRAAEAVARYRDDPDADFHALAATITSLDRSAAKAVNFAKIYGAGVRKFGLMIGKPLAEAQRIYEQYDRELPFLHQLSDIYSKRARDQGYITLCDNARRHFNRFAPGGTWGKGTGPCEAEEARRRQRDPAHPWYRQQVFRVDVHTALNALIQGSAARHTKLWMRAVWREGIVPLLQMHDCLDCSVSSREQAELVARLGCEAVQLDVPMRVDLKYGRTWGDAKHGWEELHGETAPAPNEHVEISITTKTPDLGISSGPGVELAPPRCDDANLLYELLNEPAFGSPIADPEEPLVCAYCQLQIPVGADCTSTYADGWLHPQCVDSFLRRRMTEEGIPWESPTQTVFATAAVTPPWATPIPAELTPGSAEFAAIMATLSADDRAIVWPTETGRGNGADRSDEPASVKANGGGRHESLHGNQDPKSRGNYGERTSEQQADDPFAPVHNSLLAKGYVPARDFPFTLPGVNEPLFYERRYELRPGIAPTKKLPRKTSRYFRNVNGCLMSGTGPRRIIFNWPAIMAAGPGSNAFVTEGANKSKPLNDAGLLSTATPYHVWPPECAGALRGLHVFYLEDHDHPDADGKRAAEKLSANARAKLAPVAASFRIVPALHLWRNLGPGGEPPHGWDVKDWIEAGGDAAKLVEICHGVVADGNDPLLWHGEPDPRPRRKWRIKGMMPAIGVGLLAGQWGTFKTFMAIELATTVIVDGRAFCGREVVEPGGVLILAVEGGFELRDRIDAAVRDKCPGLTRAPISWRESCPTLLANGATEQLIKVIQEAGDECQARFGMPIALVIIDVLVDAAGYAKAGDENDPAVCAKLMGVIHDAAKACDCFILAVDHFGKTVESGTRGGSSKEASADVVLALLGERETSGAIVNTRLTLRKVRGGPSGQEFPFKARIIPIREEEDEEETTCVIDWETAAAALENDPWEKARLVETKLAMKNLRRAMMKLLATHGVDRAPEPGTPSTRMIDQERVREEFFASTAADGDARQKQKVKSKRFSRVLERAENDGLIGRREIDGITYVWFMDL
jgi:DNA polymerase I-like protein with 3'-5' exonuclease and polymerase domains